MKKKDHPYHDESMWKGASSEIFARAQNLRTKMTEAEIKLWEVLRENKLDGHKFRRQHPVHRFIVDFYCHKLKLAVEVDGDYHKRNEQMEKDAEREKLLNSMGIQVIRFTNDKVLNDMNSVIFGIREKIKILVNE